MVSVADMYYFGSRGLNRDQPLALRYYSSAFSTTNMGIDMHRDIRSYAMCCAAAMHLKGEGGPANISEALRLYEDAASMGSVKAMNGLGYIYYNGVYVTKNESRAYEYFITAASSQSDADSLANSVSVYTNLLTCKKYSLH
jgi:TPR repeat protein